MPSEAFSNNYRLISGALIDEWSILLGSSQAKRYLCDPYENARYSWATKSSTSLIMNALASSHGFMFFRLFYSEERVESTYSYCDSIADSKTRAKVARNAITGIIDETKVY